MKRMEGDELTPVRATAFKGSLIDEILSRMALFDGDAVLELACGSGWLCYKLAEILKGDGEVVGIDVSENAIRKATEGLREFPFSNITFRVEDVHNIEYTNQFDYVISINAIHHFTDRGEVFKRVKGSLKPGGKFLVIDYNSDSILMKVFDKLSIDHGGSIRFINPEQLEELYNSHGFKDIKIERKRLYRLFSIMIGSGEIASER